jgi:hypothetical protein
VPARCPSVRTQTIRPYFRLRSAFSRFHALHMQLARRAQLQGLRGRRSDALVVLDTCSTLQSHRAHYPRTLSSSRTAAVFAGRNGSRSYTVAWGRLPPGRRLTRSLPVYRWRRWCLRLHVLVIVGKYLTSSLGSTEFTGYEWPLFVDFQFCLEREAESSIPWRETLLCGSANPGRT